MPLSSLAIAAGAVHITWQLQVGSVRAWDHLTNDDALPTWLGEARGAELRVGGQVVVDHGDGYLCESRVTMLEPGSRLVATWRFPDEPESLISLLLTAETGGEDCQLVLSHSHLDDLTSSYAPGWLTHLTYLDASLAGNPLPRREFWRIHHTLASLHAHDGVDQTSFSVARRIGAPRRAVWEMIVDPAQHHRFDATAMVGSLASTQPTAEGDVFTMNMTYTTADTRQNYRSDNHVLLLDPGVSIAWATALPGGPPLGWSWRYDLDDAADGTHVRLTYDWTGTPPENIGRFGVPLADPTTLTLSLERLAHALSADSPPIL